MSDYSEHLISMAGGDGEPDLAAIQARADAATKGPWHAGRGATPDGSELVHTYEQKAAFLALSLNEGESSLWLVDNCAVIPAVTGDGPNAESNAMFTAHARTDVPALIALVRDQARQAREQSRKLDAVTSIAAKLGASNQCEDREIAEDLYAAMGLS